MELYALTFTLIRQLAHYIALERRSVNNIIIRIFGIEHRESIVMACSEADVFSSRLLKGTNPLLSVELSRIKTFCSLSVLLVVNISVLQIPFSLSKHAVYTPVKEYTEFVICKVLTRLYILWSRLITLLSECRCGEQ